MEGVVAGLEGSLLGRFLADGGAFCVHVKHINMSNIIQIRSER